MQVNDSPAHVRPLLDAIREVHPNIDLPSFPWKEDQAVTQPTSVFSEDFKLIEFCLPVNCRDFLSMTHLVGHAIDFAVLGTNRFASGDVTNPLMRDLVEALAKSDAVSRLWQLSSSERVQIVDSATGESAVVDVPPGLRDAIFSHELFARAYTQFIASRADFQPLSEQLTRTRHSLANEAFPQYWTDADFRDINDSISNLLLAGNVRGIQVVQLAPRQEDVSETQSLLHRILSSDSAFHAVTSLDPLEFEQFVAESLAEVGMTVELTKQSHDGGIDVIARNNTHAGSHLYYVQCKHVLRRRVIGVEALRSLYGVVESGRATMGLLVTTYGFSRSAEDFQRANAHRLSLINAEGILTWLAELRRG